MDNRITGAVRRAEEDTAAVAAHGPTLRRDDGGDNDVPPPPAYDVGTRTRTGPGLGPARCSAPASPVQQPACHACHGESDQDGEEELAQDHGFMVDHQQEHLLPSGSGELNLYTGTETCCRSSFADE
jgi:hypothetical protein